MYRIDQEPLGIQIPPPDDFLELNPSALFVYFQEITALTLEEMATGIDEFLKSGLGSGTIDAWASGNIRPRGVRRMAFLSFVRFHVISNLERSWTDAFVQCWANNNANETEKRLRQKEGRLKDEEISASVFERHHNWIGEQNLKPVRDERFSIADIYVPIKIIAHGVETGIEQSDQVFEPQYLNGFALDGIEDKTNINWVFIKGSPGSGKSVLANMLAADLTMQSKIQVAYLNMSRASAKRPINSDNLPLVIDDECGALEFLEYFKIGKIQELVLILDGLDEIGGDSKSTQQLVQDSLNEIKSKILEVESFDKKVRVIVFGRESVTEVAVNNFSNGNCKLFSMGDLSGKIKSDDEESEAFVYGENLRSVWWQKFETARGFDCDDQVPAFLSHNVHPLYELAKEPLLAYLISRSVLAPDVFIDVKTNAVQMIDEGVKDANRNSIYAKIIDDVRQAKKWNSGRNKPVLPPKEFLDVLNYIALATWQEGSNRTATIRRILDVIPNDEIANSFSRLITQYDSDGSSNLLTAFYYRISETAEERLEHQFEFTHKTFSEYLLAIFIFDAFENLITHQTSRVAEQEKIAHLHKWIELVMAGPDSTEIAKFILSEAELRFENRSFHDWSTSFDVIRELHALSHVTTNTSQPWLIGQSSVLRIKRASAMIFLMWGALNKVHYDQTGEQVEFGTDNVIEGHDLELMRSPYNLEQYMDGTEMGALAPETFMASSLSGLYICEDDLSGTYLNNGIIHGLKLEELNASFSIWNKISMKGFDVNSVNMRNSRYYNWSISETNFTKTNFRQSRFYRFTASSTKFTDCQLEQNEWRYATFNSCHFTDVYFCRSDMINTDFISCTFTRCDFEACLVDKLEFMNCTFTETQFEKETFDEECFVSCQNLEFIS